MPLSLPILTFHDIADRSSVISFPPQIFRRGMAKLHESGYRTLSLIDAANCLRNDQAFPARSLVITFDDGYGSVYEKAFPVLQRYGMSATVFLTVGKAENLDQRLSTLQGRAMLSWSSIREMLKHGMSFGAHTLTHPDLTHLSLDGITEEVLGSKDIIENALGTSVSSFTYPYGRYNNSVRAFVRQHFVCACSDRLGLIKTNSDLYALERVDSYYLRTDRLFNLTRTGILPWYIAARAVPRRLRRAIQFRQNFRIDQDSQGK